MLIVLLSLFSITLMIWLINKVSPFAVCPICVGVSGTWLWMLAGRFLGYPADNAVLALLMGGSVVGIAYQLENYIPKRKALLWKSFFIPAGFFVTYNVILSLWAVSFIGLVILFIGVLMFFVVFGEGETKKTREIEENMRQCC